MANIRIPGLVARTNKDGILRWYWQPSATLKKAGWQTIVLGKDEGVAITAARARNAEVAEWKIGGNAKPRIAKREASGTLGALIARYRKEVLHGLQRDGRRVIAESTASVYGPSLKRLDMWAGKYPLAYITPGRVRALRDAMCAPADQGGITHHSAHQTLKMGRQLFSCAISWDLWPQGQNPFTNFRLAAPPPRSIICSAPAREGLIAAATQAGMPSMALAITLGIAIGQREADLLKLQHSHYAPVPEHKMQAEDFSALAAMAPDGIPRAIRVRQNKTKAWIEIPVVGEVRRLVERNIALGKAGHATAILLDDSRSTPERAALYQGKSGQARFQRDFAATKAAAIASAIAAGDDDLAQELTDVQFRDFRRTCVVYLGELGFTEHLIASITGHDLDETMRILKTYMPRTTGRAAHTVVQIAQREQREAERKSNTAA